MEIKYTKSIPVIGDYDVIVAGSGPAGLCAAVSSARFGVKTAVVERYGIIGGGLTIGHISPVMGSVGEGTMSDEVLDLLQSSHSHGRIAHDFEHAKIVLTEWLENSGADLFLQSPVVDVIIENNRPIGLIIGTKQGLQVIKAKVIIDATGDGTVSYLSGASFECGRLSDGLMQPVTIMFTLAGVDDAAAISPGNHTYDVRMPGSDFRKRCHEASLNGLLPEYASFVRLYRSVRPGECMVNATQENYINGLESEDISRAEFNLRKQILQIRDYLRTHVKGFENCYLTGSSNTLGIRETRRVTGEYTLSEEDVLNGRKFPDAIVSDAKFIIDIHNPTGPGQADERPVKPYDIPYRCLVPRDIDGLLTAGRCISGSHHAHASYRVMNICMATGQAAGIAAALSIKQNVQPRRLDYKDIQCALREFGVKLPRTESE